MPRKLRIECAGAMYHVMSRGNRRQDIFLDDIDRHDFLKTTEIKRVRSILLYIWLAKCRSEWQS